MTVDIVFVWVIGTIYQPFFLMKINFNKKTFGSWKIIVDDFCWYVFADLKKNATIIAISVKSERCVVTIYKELTFRKTVIEFVSDIMKILTKPFISSLTISKLFLNEFIFSWPNINLLTLLLRISFNTCCECEWETLEKSSAYILTSLLHEQFKFCSVKPNRFLAKRELPLLFRSNFLTPKCSSFMLPLSIRGMFSGYKSFSV